MLHHFCCCQLLTVEAEQEDIFLRLPHGEGVALLEDDVVKLGVIRHSIIIVGGQAGHDFRQSRGDIQCGTAVILADDPILEQRDGFTIRFLPPLGGIVDIPAPFNQSKTIGNTGEGVEGINGKLLFLRDFVAALIFQIKLPLRQQKR